MQTETQQPQGSLSAAGGEDPWTMGKDPRDLWRQQDRLRQPYMGDAGFPPLACLHTDPEPACPSSVGHPLQAQLLLGPPENVEPTYGVRTWTSVLERRTGLTAPPASTFHTQRRGSTQRSSCPSLCPPTPTSDLFSGKRSGLLGPGARVVFPDTQALGRVGSGTGPPSPTWANEHSPSQPSAQPCPLCKHGGLKSTGGEHKPAHNPLPSKPLPSLNGVLMSWGTPMLFSLDPQPALLPGLPPPWLWHK